MQTMTYRNVSETTTFTMRSTTSRVSYKNSRGEFGDMDRNATLAEINRLLATGYTPVS